MNLSCMHKTYAGRIRAYNIIKFAVCNDRGHLRDVHIIIGRHSSNISNRSQRRPYKSGAWDNLC